MNNPDKSMPKRILFMIWSLDLGGAEQVVMNLVKNLDAGRFVPIVCCLNEKGRYASEVESAGIRVIEMRKRPKFDLTLIPRLIKVIREEKIDLVHTHLFTAHLWGRIAARLANVPVISTEHGMDVWRTSFHLLLDKLLTPISSRIIFVSEGVRKYYEKVNPALHRVALEKKCVVIHNGIDVSRFQFSGGAGSIHELGDVLEKLGLRRGTIVLGTVGRFVPEKSHVDFIEVVKLLREEGKDVTGLLIGDGPLEEKLKRLVEENELTGNVIFPGFSREMAKLYHTMNLFVLTSLREGFPMTVLEAMASGIPVIATRVGGLPEIITDGENGFLVPPGDAEVLAETILKVIGDQGLRDHVVMNARRRVETNFSIQAMVAHHEALYEEVLA